VARFIARRILLLVPLLFGIVLLGFGIVKLAPGDPVQVLVGDYPAPPEYVAQVRARFGLDRPAWVQLGRYLGEVLRGNLGYSFFYNEPVTTVLLGRLNATLLLMGAAFALVLISLALMVAYEERFKASGWSGNLLIGWLVGSLFLFAGLCVYAGRVAPLEIAASLALLAGLSTVAREVVKDIEDVAGDVGRTTLARTRGVAFAGRVAQGVLLAAILLSAVPILLGVLGPWYAALVAAADGIFIYAALHAARSPGRSERAMKAAMVVALVAFLAGGFR